ncbi:MAG: DUF2817 domain-containing protein [Burkholderiales bacterium]|nr:DUF2817 domain-containing protein [Burkholderiales bacterium]
MTKNDSLAGAGSLPELEALEAVIARGRAHLRCEVACRVEHLGRSLPVHAITLGGEDPALPAAGFFGGVHGLERIGSRVVIAFLEQLVARLDWDRTLHQQLAQVRLLFMPIVNPAGMARGTRANPAGVDLMRNAPVEARDPVPFLLAGQRLSPGLPWYRGAAGAPMEAESAALCAWAERELLGRPLALALDCHSGFGMRDRIWFPFAHRRAPFAALPELHALHAIFAGSHPRHPYVFEPQSAQYLAHGDLWDHLVLRADGRPGVFLPLTLEMGSWLWVKKNPRQLFSRHGVFNPLIEHREQRVLRRHLPLLDFLLRAAASQAHWLPQAQERERHRREALARWYGGNR